jgi:hypothetical protein
MKLSFWFSFDDSHFEDWKGMNTQLNHKINFKFQAFVLWPIGVVFVNLWALSTSAYNRWEPILFLKKYVSCHRCEKIETSIETKLKNILNFFFSLFAFVFWVNDFFNPVFYEMEVTIFDHLCWLNCLRKCRRSLYHTKTASRLRTHSSPLIRSTIWR